MRLYKQALAMLAGAVSAMLIAAPATADMSRFSGGRVILAQDYQGLSEEEIRRLKREERRKRKQERQQKEQAEQHKQDRRERQRAEEEERRQKAQERRERQKAKQEERRQDRRERQKAEEEERRQKAQERRERQKAKQEERRQDRRERQRAEEEERRKKVQERRERHRAKQEEREERKRERRERQQAEDDDREKLLKRLDEERKRALEEAEERRTRREERRREELADQEKERSKRAKRITEQQEEERKERRARRLENIEGGELSQEERNWRRGIRKKFTREKLRDIKRARREHREAGGSMVIEEPDNRRIVRKGKHLIIENDDTERLRGERDAEVKHGPHGRTRTTITRRNGTQIITVRNSDGDVVRRIKRLPDGREIVLYNNEPRRRHSRRSHRDHDNGFSFFIDLPDFRITAPRNEYYVYADEADEDEIEDVLTAAPLEEFDEDYTLEEIRYSPDIRARLRRLNVNTVHFESGSWDIQEDQYDKLEVVARVINRIIERNESEVFLIAGHTDAIGSDEDNLSLSDRRAETVARILTDEFGVPPENLVTQGYGESDLLIDTQDDEAANRRVEFMRITPALAQYDE